MRCSLFIVFSFLSYLIFSAAEVRANSSENLTKCLEDLYPVSGSQDLAAKLDECLHVGLLQNLSYLPTYIKEQKQNCEMATSGEQINCLRPALLRAQATLACNSNPQRKSEMADYDDQSLLRLAKTYGEGKIPKPIQEKFHLLLVAAKKLFPLYDNQSVQLTAYRAKELNAHASASGQIMASSALWSFESPLFLEEIIAILAHEVGHTIQAHSLQLGCLALEWVGTEYKMSEIMTAFREDLSLNEPRGKAWSETSIRYELEADQLSMRLLREMNLAPNFMIIALQKLKPKSHGGFSSGSHPDFENRIKAASEYAKKLKLHPSPVSVR